MRTTIGTLLCSTLLLGACARGLVVQRDAGDAFSTGVPQVLPFTQFEVTATWRLARCESAPVRAGDEPVGPEIKLVVTATPHSEDDPDQRYLIDPTSLQSPVTRSQFSVTYHEGSNTIHTVNAEIEDRSAAVAGNLVTTAVNLAPLLMGVSIPPDLGIRAFDGPAPPACTTDAKIALARAERLKAQLDEQTAALTEATDAVTTLAARVARLGTAVDTATSSAYARALETLDRLAVTQAALNAQLEDALKPLTHATTVRWPMSGTDRATTAPFTLPLSVVRGWISDGRSEDWPQAHLAIESLTGERAPQRSLPRHAQARSGAAVAAAAPREPDEGVPPDRHDPAYVTGIPYNIPVRGRLVACSAPCDRVPDDAQNHRVVAEGSIAQLGNVRLLRVRNPALGSTTFQAVFARDATLTSTGYAQRTAPLETATSAIADATGRIAPLFDPTERRKRETAYLEALQARREATAALTPAPTNPHGDEIRTTDFETALINARIANLQAQTALAGLSPPAGP